jgi:hypothetical protein
MSFGPETHAPVIPDRPLALPTRLPRHTPKPCALHEDHLFRAGQVAPPGVYQEVDGRRRTVVLDRSDYLPASLNGQVACYQLVSADVVADKRF